MAADSIAYVAICMAGLALVIHAFNYSFNTHEKVLHVTLAHDVLIGQLLELHGLRMKIKDGVVLSVDGKVVFEEIS